MYRINTSYEFTGLLCFVSSPACIYFAYMPLVLGLCISAFQPYGSYSVEGWTFKCDRVALSVVAPRTPGGGKWSDDPKSAPPRGSYCGSTPWCG